MLRMTWKSLGLAALIAAGMPVATMSGASALTLPMPANTGVEINRAVEGKVIEIASKRNRDLGSRRYNKKSYQKHSNQRYKSNRQHSYKTNRHQSRKHAWHYNRNRHGHRYSHRRHGYGYRYGNYWYAQPWWSLQVVPSAPSYYASSNSAHVQYCLNKYRSYNPQTDMYLGYDGRYHYCVSPY